MPLRAGEKTAAGEGKAGGFPHAGKTGQIPPKEGLQITSLKHPPCASPNGRSLRLDAHDLVRQKEPMADLITNSKSYQDLLAGLKNQILTAGPGGEGNSVCKRFFQCLALHLTINARIYFSGF